MTNKKGEYHRQEKNQSLNQGRLLEKNYLIGKYVVLKNKIRLLNHHKKIMIPDQLKWHLFLKHKGVSKLGNVNENLQRFSMDLCQDILFENLSYYMGTKRNISYFSFS